MSKPQQECISQIQENANKKIYDRNIPSQLLQPYLDVRAVSTKYSYFPIVDPRKENSVSFEQMPKYNVHKIFNPGNTQSPWSGFVSNINTESELRNQIFALQKCSQNEYVPSSKSDLFNYKFQTKKEPTSHNLLFEHNSFQQFNPNPDSNIIGTCLFMNSTRSQMKDLTKQSC